ncbi:Uncharacterized protein QTN25_006064 [Entamoeba marina]
MSLLVSHQIIFCTFIITLITYVNAGYLRSCTFLDNTCDNPIVCEYTQLDVCLVRTHISTNPPEHNEFSFITKATPENAIATYYWNTTSCSPDAETFEDSIKLANCESAEDVFYYRQDIVKELDDAIAWFTESRSSFDKEPICGLPTSVEAASKGCIKFPGGASAMYRKENDHIICETFHDDKCVSMNEVVLNQTCGECFVEDLGYGIWKSRKLVCSAKEVEVEIASRKEEL